MCVTRICMRRKNQNANLKMQMVKVFKINKLSQQTRNQKNSLTNIRSARAFSKISKQEQHLLFQQLHTRISYGWRRGTTCQNIYIEPNLLEFCIILHFSILSSAPILIFDSSEWNRTVHYRTSDRSHLTFFIHSECKHSIQVVQFHFTIPSATRRTTRKSMNGAVKCCGACIGF